MFDFSTLIVDRNESDSAQFKALIKKPITDWTDEEKNSFYYGLLKGNYSYTDINRVQSAVDHLKGALDEMGYIANVTHQGDFGISETQRASWAHRYLENIKGVMQPLKVASKLPDSLIGLSYTDANRIEQALLDVDSAIRTMELSLIPCGEAVCGDDAL